MTKKLIIRPYKLGSAGAKLLASALSDLVGYKVKLVKEEYVPTRAEVVINWGSTDPYHKIEEDSNAPPQKATNKLSTFQAFKEHEVPCPVWTTEKATAAGWVEGGEVVIARKTLSGSNGSGIVVVQPGNNVPNAPLFVKYKKKRKEFRAHVIHGEVVEVVEKRKKAGAQNVDTMIRNHGNGWVFCKNDVVVPDDLKEVAIKAVKAVGLNFGAVDLIWNQNENKTYALEVNSAPGIEGGTVAVYAQAFRKHYAG